MRNLTCIACPMGCALNIEESSNGGGDNSPALIITGNRCPRGAAYAQEEILAPKRIVTATCAIAGGASGKTAGTGPLSLRRIPVKSSAPCPREKIPLLLADIYKIKIALPVKAGDTVIAGWKGEGINVVAARTVQ